MALIQTKEKAQEAKEMYELKQRAKAFYAENGVPQKMEDILNSMFYDNPDDVYGHLVSTCIVISVLYSSVIATFI